ncbi:MAG: EamA family transporter [Hyphomicrobiaceae bacterium]
MKKLILLGFLALLVVDTTQQVLAKFAGDRIGAFDLDGAWITRLFHEPILYVLLGLYALAFVIYSWLLRHAPVGPSYAALHGHVVTTFLISVLFLGERLTLLQLSGCALIVGGIVLLAATEKL